MKIDSLKELKALIKLCRQLGVDAIEVDNVKFGLGPEPVTYKQQKGQATSFISNNTDGTPDLPNIKTPDALTEEQMLFYSAVGNAEQQ